MTWPEAFNNVGIMLGIAFMVVGTIAVLSKNL